MNLEMIQAIVSLRGLPKILQVVIYVLFGLSAGLSLFIARVSNAASYLSDLPQACINCHVMTDAYVSWQRGSHGLVAVCVDCHVPHSNPAGKYAFKATDGLKHSYIFTFRKEPQVLELSRLAAPVVQGNCVRCHTTVLAMIRLAGSGERKCWDCHNNFHGFVHSISASPAELGPVLPKAGIITSKKGVE
jgi:cytochrome c nitrite reductase small subunit